MGLQISVSCPRLLEDTINAREQPKFPFLSFGRTEIFAGKTFGLAGNFCIQITLEHIFTTDQLPCLAFCSAQWIGQGSCSVVISLINNLGI